jgi:hypothetical protein
MNVLFKLKYTKEKTAIQNICSNLIPKYLGTHVCLLLVVCLFCNFDSIVVCFLHSHFLASSNYKYV